jgi:predicted outer membrane repeat protein
MRKKKIVSSGRAQSIRKFEALEDRRLLTTFNVNTTIDRPIDTSLTTLAHPFGNGGKLTLREAVYLADLNSSQASVIDLKGNSTYKLTVAGAGEDNDFTGDLDIFWKLTIQKTGGGSDPVIDGNGLDRVLDLANDGLTVTLNHLVITGGIARTSGQGGGGIRGTTDETLILNNTTVKNNIAGSPGNGQGGAIWLDDGSDLTLNNSHVDGNSAAAGINGIGGGIYLGGISGTLTIKNSTVNNNSSYVQGGGIYDGALDGLIVSNSQINNNHTGDRGGGGVYVGVEGGMPLSFTSSSISGNTTTGAGGGIFVSPDGLVTMNITKSTLNDNSAASDGGAVYGALDTIVNATGSTMANNTSGGGGGAIDRFAGGTFMNCTFTHNVAQGNGGAMDERESAGDFDIVGSTFTGNVALTGTGGAINGSPSPGHNFDFTDSKFTLNSAAEGGGAIDVDGELVNVLRCTFDHNKTLDGDGGAIDGDTDNPSSIGATNSTFTYNTSKADGGAIDSEGGDITLTSCVVSHDTATNGQGGGFADGGGTGNTTTVTDTTVDSNTAGGNGGGIAASGGTLIMTCSTVSNNRSGSDGGGIYLGVVFGGPASSIVNCTISGNGAANAGGGIASDATNNITITNDTIAFNFSALGGGLAQTGNLGLITIGNTIIAKNIATTDPDVYTNPFAIEDAGHNLVFTDPQSLFTDPSDIVGIDPLLGPLANNGGPTKTHALLKGSPAINTGDDSLAPSTDQRGVKRPQGPHVDIGAYEKK